MGGRALYHREAQRLVATLLGYFSICMEDQVQRSLSTFSFQAQVLL